MEEPYKERDPFLSFLLPFVFYFFLLSLLSEMEMEKEKWWKERRRKKEEFDWVRVVLFFL